MIPEATRGTVLLVDDDDALRRALAGELSRRGWFVVGAGTGEAALREAPRCGAEVVLLDLRLPDMDGIEVLTRLREREVPAAVIVLTGHGTIDTAIQAIRKGAYDYLEKPCPIEKVELALEKAREHRDLVARQRVLQDGYAAPDVRAGFVGASPAFRRLSERIARVARADTTTLVTGETGVGKETVAMLLHAESPRKDAPFVVVDCGTLDEDLLRSELFGHEKGAFTSATRQKHGLFEVAHGGTIFLDEVGNTSPEIQAKLLRVLETGRFRRLGGNREIAVDVRIVSATNRDLKGALGKARFREDLYFRLSTLTVDVPPLRERREDIPLLVEHYVTRLNRRLSLSARFDAAAMDALSRYAWPGNVRELIHVLEHAMVLADRDVIGPEDLPDPVRAPRGRADPAAPEEPLASLAEMEQAHVLRVTDRVDGNRGRASRILGISERHLYRLLRKYGRPAGEPSDDGAAPAGDRMS